MVCVCYLNYINSLDLSNYYQLLIKAKRTSLVSFNNVTNWLIVSNIWVPNKIFWEDILFLLQDKKGLRPQCSERGEK